MCSVRADDFYQIQTMVIATINAHLKIPSFFRSSTRWKKMHQEKMLDSRNENAVDIQNHKRIISDKHTIILIRILVENV